MAGVFPGTGGSSESTRPIIVQAQPAPTVAPTTAETVAAPPPAPVKQPPPPSPVPSPPPTASAPKQATVKTPATAGTLVGENTRATFLAGRLVVRLGEVEAGRIARLELMVGDRTCTFTGVRAGEAVGVHTRKAVGVKVTAVSASGAALKAASARAPRNAPACLRG